MIQTLKNEACDFREKMTINVKTGWFAGMGAISRVENGGREWFDTLVAEGKNKKRQPTMLEKSVTVVGDTGTKLTQKVRGGVEQFGGNLMERTGIPSRKQINELIQRVDELTTKLEKKAS